MRYPVVVVEPARCMFDSETGLYGAFVVWLFFKMMLHINTFWVYNTVVHLDGNILLGCMCSACNKHVGVKLYSVVRNYSGRDYETGESKNEIHKHGLVHGLVYKIVDLQIIIKITKLEFMIKYLH